MLETRLSLALSQGLLRLPSDPIGVLNADAQMDLSFATPDMLYLSQGFYPDHAALKQRGFNISVAPEAPVAAAVVMTHRSKPASFDLIAQALALTEPGGLIAVEGPKTDGIESLLKAAKSRFDDVESYAKAHGKLFWFTRPATLPNIAGWHARPRTLDGGFITYPGVFSADGIDKGSALLAAHLPPLQGRVADLGAGWGYLSRHILQSDKISALSLIEADHTALDAAKQNIDDPRAEFIWGDATTHDDTQFDVVVSNPPFHIGRKAAPELGQRFIARAAQLLAPKGQFWMVANRNLPYEQTLQAHFAQVKTIVQTAGFKMICASRPRDSAQIARARR